MHYPSTFVDDVYRIFGDAGRAWLPHLPELLVECRARWGLPEGTPCATMSMNYIEFTTTPDGKPVALKVGVPHHELFTEMEALRIYSGEGAVRLVDADCDLGAILEQRARPGTMLWQTGDNHTQTEAAAVLMRILPKPVPEEHALPHFADWVERAFRLTRTEWDPQERMPRDLLDAAEAAFYGIIEAGDADMVLHGDLHHENILWDAEAGWLAIDPKGVIGPRALELGRYMQNQLPEGVPLAVREPLIRERLAIFSEALNLPPKIVAASTLVDCVLSHCWGFEEEALNPDWYEGIEMGYLMRQIMEA